MLHESLAVIVDATFDPGCCVMAPVIPTVLELGDVKYTLALGTRFLVLVPTHFLWRSGIVGFLTPTSRIYFPTVTKLNRVVC